MIKSIILFFVICFLTSNVFAENYQYDLEAIKKHAQKQIKVIEKKLEEQKKQEEQVKKAKEIQDLFDKAEFLYQQGEVNKAKALYEQVYKLSKDSSIIEYIKRTNKVIARQERAQRESDLARKRREKEGQRQEKERQLRQE
jgi:hypothetical protein